MLPSIPVSPLIQQSLNCASQLAEFTKKIADQQKDDIDYYEQQSIAQRIKLDLITKQMHSVRDLLYHHWQPEALAKQIVIINVDLFLHHQVKQLNDFHTYLLHSLAHQIIISNSHSYATAFDFAIRLARCLHQYRDWNGCMAVLRCLSLPSLKRLYYTTTTTTSHPLIHDFPWMQQDIDSSYLQAFQQSLLPLRPYSLEAQEHKRTRSLSTSSFHSKKKKKATYVIAIPWFPPILDLVSEQDREILMDICRYNHWPKQPSITRALFNLSDNDNNNMNSSSLKNIPPMLPSSSIFDLATSLGQGDLLICHWLLSRAFLTLDQLDSESEIIKPTSNNEVQHQQHQRQLSDNGIIMDSVDNEEVEVEEDEIEIVEEIEQLHVDNPIEIMELEEDREVNVNVALLSSKSSLESNYNNNDENNTIQQDDNDDKNEIKSENIANTTNIPSTSHSPSTSIHSVDFTNLRTIQQGSIVSDPTPKLDTIKDNNDNSINGNGLQLEEQQYHLLNSNNDTDTSSIGNTREQINGNSMDESKIQTDKPVDISPFKSATLSETIDNNIPIFDNSNQPLKEDSHNDVKSIHTDGSIENSIDKMENNNCNGKVDDMMEIKSENNHSIKESNAINQNGVIEVVEEEEKRDKKEDDNEDDDASEQWTGYPMPKEDMENSNQDYDMEEEDEVWTGYPEPNQHDEHQYHHHHNKTISSDEASEEEWKGYHATSEEAKWQEETILKVQQQEWQGYALETLDEDELDSSTVITNRYEKTYQSGNIILNHPIHSSSS